MSTELLASLTVVNKLGLHARASSKLVMLVAQHPEVAVCIQRSGDGDNWVDAANLVLLLMLGAGKGTELTLRVQGDKETSCHEAQQAVLALFDSCFDEQQ